MKIEYNVIDDNSIIINNISKYDYDYVFDIVETLRGRKINENKLLDYIHGEIVFDGKRSHIIIAGTIILILLSWCIWLTFLLMKKNAGVGSNSSSSPKKKNL